MDFLRDSWQRRAESESQTEVAGGLSEDLKIFNKLEDIRKNISKEDIPEDLKELIEDYHKELIDSMNRYVTAIEEYNLGKYAFRGGEKEQQDMERLDETRRLIHNGLISVLDTLAKLHAKAGLDNSWRDDVGFDRKQVQIWAQNVMNHLSREEERRQ